MVDDDLGVGVDFFQLADESESLAGVALGVSGVADDEGELGDDAEFLGSLCDGHGLIGGDALLHLFERPIGTGLRAEEDHGAAGAFEGSEGFVGIPGHDVDTGLAALLCATIPLWLVGIDGVVTGRRLSSGR